MQRAITLIIASSLSSLAVSAAWAADPTNAAIAQASAKDDATPEQPAEVLKTKTKSNQSNDRLATPAPTTTTDVDAAPAAGVVKTKTKSNQSNDRAATPVPGKDTAETAEPAEVVKTKTKSNQSND
jgi:hypothetical protein